MEIKEESSRDIVPSRKESSGFKDSRLASYRQMPNCSREFLKSFVVLRSLQESESFCRKIVHRHAPVKDLKFSHHDLHSQIENKSKKTYYQLSHFQLDPEHIQSGAFF
jgi:hypothetical protein